MKILLLGSVLVVLGVIGLAAIEWIIQSVTMPRTDPDQPIFRYVAAAPNDADGPRAIVWHTSTGPNDCTILHDRLKREEQARLTDLISSADSSGAGQGIENPCAVFQLGEVDPGAEVEVVGDCGRMARVRILSGALRERTGCIATDRLKDSRG